MDLDGGADDVARQIFVLQALALSCSFFKASCLENTGMPAKIRKLSDAPTGAILIVSGCPTAA